MADGAVSAAPTDGQLSTLTTLAAELVRRQELVDTLTQQLKEATQARDDMQNVHLPEAMATLGMASFTTQEGFRIEVKPIVSASIPKAKLTEALQWLRKHQHGGLIKTTVKVLFGKGEEDKAQKVIQSLKTKGYDFSFDEGVHAQTLTAWVKEMDKQDKTIPDELFGVYRAKQAKLTYTGEE